MKIKKECENPKCKKVFETTFTSNIGTLTIPPQFFNGALEKYEEQKEGITSIYN